MRLLITVPVRYSYDPTETLSKEVEFVQSAMSKALDYLEGEGDPEALLSQNMAWVSALKQAMKRVKEPDLSSFLFKEFSPYVYMKPGALAKAFKSTAEWLQKDKSLERRIMPWDRVIYMVHVPDVDGTFAAKYRVMRVFRAHEHLEVL